MSTPPVTEITLRGRRLAHDARVLELGFPDEHRFASEREGDVALREHGFRLGGSPAAPWRASFSAPSIINAGSITPDKCTSSASEPASS